jgi:hypothetical protein
MSVLMAAMAIGVILNREPIAGSCGGMKKLGLGGECEICGGNSQKCDEQKQNSQTDDKGLAYDASAVGVKSRG